MIPSFTFTRNPSTKVTVKTLIASLLAADNLHVIFAQKAAAGGSATAGQLVTIENYGDPVAAATECVTKFGTASQAQDMVVAAINAVKSSSYEDKVFPPIKVFVLANGATSATLAAELATIANQQTPFITLPYPSTDSVALAALKAHLVAISANDRGALGQFGSFGVMATDAATATATPTGLSAGSELINIAWLRDSAGTKANKIECVAAAYGAILAALGLPFNPINDLKIGGLVAPVSAADWHTPGDAGTVALGLNDGVVPLTVNASGEICVSRSISSRVVTSGVVETAYYDHQDWRVLFYLRKNIYNLAVQPRYKQAKASTQKLAALKSEILALCKTLEVEPLQMLQHVDLLADQFTYARQPNNRHAAVYYVPVNVIPGFHNKGVELVGTTQFDSVVI